MQVGRRSVVVWSVAVAAAALGSVVAALILTSSLVTGDRAELLLIDVIGGWALVGAGSVAYLQQRDPRIGLLMFAAGCAWLLAGLRWSDSSSAAQTTGLASSWLWAALLAHLAVAFPGGRLEGRLERALVIAAYVIAMPGRLTWMVLADQRVTFMNEPLVHPLSCEFLPLVLPGHGLGASTGAAEALRWVEQVAVVLVALGVIGMLALHWRRGTAVARRALAPLLGVGAATAIVLAAGTAAGAAGGNDAGRAIEWMWDACVVALPLAFLAGVLRMRLRGAAGLARTLEELDGLPGDGDVATGAGARARRPLARAGLLAARRRALRRSRRPRVRRPGRRGRAVTPIELRGRRIGALVHDPSLLHEPDVIRAAGQGRRRGGSSARRSRPNAMRAWWSCARRALALSRRGIWSAGASNAICMTARSERLAGLLLQTKLRRRAGTEPVEAEALLDDLEQGLAQALAELRALAAGILPPVLSDHGLAAALEELAARLPVPLVIDADGVGRVDRRAEAAAYFVVAESLANVIKHAHAERVVARVTRDDRGVLIEVADDGVGGASVNGGTGLRGLVDRVAALDGTLTWTSPTGAGTVVRAEIPCAS